MSTLDSTMEKPVKTHQRMRGASLAMQETAHTLRHNMTLAEDILWNAIKSRQLKGLKFRRQHVVGTFILDFYCPLHKLVIEVDGSIHEEQREHDAERTRKLEEFGCKVLRFQNDEVTHNLPSVLQRILNAIE